MSDLDFEAIINFDYLDVEGDVTNTDPLSAVEEDKEGFDNSGASRDVLIDAHVTEQPDYIDLVDDGEDGKEVSTSLTSADQIHVAKGATLKSHKRRALPRRAGKPTNFQPYGRYDEFCQSNREAFGESQGKRKVSRGKSTKLMLENIDTTTLFDALRARVEQDQKQTNLKLKEQEENHRESLEQRMVENCTLTQRLQAVRAELGGAKERIGELEQGLIEVKSELQDTLIKYETVFRCNKCCEKANKWKVASCGHIFCESCMWELIRQGKPCGFCQKALSGFFDCYPHTQIGAQRS